MNLKDLEEKNRVYFNDDLMSIPQVIDLQITSSGRKNYILLPGCDPNKEK